MRNASFLFCLFLPAPGYFRFLLDVVFPFPFPCRPNKLVLPAEDGELVHSVFIDACA